MLLLFLFSCVTFEPVLESGDTGLNTTQTEVTGPILAGVSTISGTCPDLSVTGRVTFISNGVEREALIYFPEEKPEGMPVIFAYHGTTSSANSILSLTGLKELAIEQNLVVVAPEALDEDLLEWGFMEENPEKDLLLFDDLRSCLYQDLKIDLTKVYATGFSAGGLWTSRLGIERADSLAAVLAFSGGSGVIFDYKTPAWRLPYLLAWGGEEDTWGLSWFVVGFEDATLTLIDQLKADKNPVYACNHSQGHVVPPDGPNMVSTWLLNHTFAQPLDYAPIVEDLPEYCYWP